MNYDLTKDLTLGAKYGLRKAQIADRSSDLFINSTADLWVVRLDYHVVHNWDVMIEARRMDCRDTGVTETGALAGAGGTSATTSRSGRVINGAMSPTTCG